MAARKKRFNSFNLSFNGNLCRFCVLGLVYAFTCIMLHLARYVPECALDANRAMGMSVKRVLSRRAPIRRLPASHRPLGEVTRRFFVKQAIEMSKEIGSAFWTGGKQLWSNWQESRRLQARMAAGERLTRTEQRFIRRTSQDIKVRH